MGEGDKKLAKSFRRSLWMAPLLENDGIFHFFLLLFSPTYRFLFDLMEAPNWIPREVSIAKALFLLQKL